MSFILDMILEQTDASNEHASMFPSNLYLRNISEHLSHVKLLQICIVMMW